jgi:hypothetical protein
VAHRFSLTEEGVVKVVTIATDVENPFLRRLLMPSCATVGLDLVVLCPAAPSAPAGHARATNGIPPQSVGVSDIGAGLPFNFADKRVILSRYLSQLCERDELIVFTDAYDTLFVRGEAYIEATYAGFGQRIVFSAESNSWPLGTVGLALYGDPPTGPYPYLNSGGFVGTAGDVLELYARYPDPPSSRFEQLERLRAEGYDADRRFGWSDQYYWTLVHLLERDSIGLDHEAGLFECFGKPYPDIDEAVREGLEFLERGTESPVYERECARLRERLRAPGGSAQVHFSSGVTKAVAMDLFDQGRLPEWLTRVLGAPPAADRARVQVHQL